MRFLRRNKPVKDDSQKALEDAQRSLERVKDKGAEVKEVAKALKDIRERNHFAEQLEAVIIRPRGQKHDARY